MARLLALTDRGPDDLDWKGPLTWQIILALAETQHEVLALTTFDAESVEFSHPRLKIARPAQNWSVVHMPAIAQTVIGFNPDVIHTFGLRANPRWPVTTVWPFLTTMCKVLPRVKRVCTLFDERDCLPDDSAKEWVEESNQFTVFCESHREMVEQRFERPTELVPFELPTAFRPIDRFLTEHAVIPAPVSEWEDADRGMQLLAEFLHRHPLAQVTITGGWGSRSASQRKHGWLLLGKCAAQVHLTAPLQLHDFLSLIDAADSIWLESLRRDSWKFLVSVKLGVQLNKDVHLSTPLTSPLKEGSMANAISRLYTHR